MKVGEWWYNENCNAKLVLLKHHLMIHPYMHGKGYPEFDGDAWIIDIWYADSKVTNEIWPAETIYKNYERLEDYKHILMSLENDIIPQNKIIFLPEETVKKYIRENDESR